MFHKLALGIVTVVTAIAGWFGIASKKDIPVLPPPVHITENRIVDRVTVHEQPVGASIPVVVSLFETSLQSSISSTANSMTLVSGSDRQGTTLSGYMCFTIDEGSSVAEFVCGTASSTSVTSLTRGISPLTGTSTVASLQYVHRRGASVKITNYPQLAIVSRILNGDETFPNRLSYDSSIATSTLTTYNLISKQYADGLALQGAPTATGTTPGIISLSSRTQLSAGTAQSGAYTLVPSNSFFAYTPVSATSVPVSNSSGKIAQGWLDLTQSFTNTGAWTFSSATTTLNATTSIAANASNKLLLNTVAYVLPSTQGGATTTLANNGSGTLSWTPFPALAGSAAGVSASFSSGTATLSTLTFTPSVAQKVLLMGTVQASNDSNSGVCRLFIDIDGTATTTVSTFTLDGSGANKKNSLNFTFLTSQLTAAQHNIRLLGAASGGTNCASDSYYNSNQFNAFYMGN